MCGGGQSLLQKKLTSFCATVLLYTNLIPAYSYTLFSHLIPKNCKWEQKFIFELVDRGILLLVLLQLLTVNLRLECLQSQSQDLANVDDPVLELERIIKEALTFNVGGI